MEINEQLDHVETYTPDISELNDPSLIPPSIKEGLDNYLEHGIPTGDFLAAAISNDLAMAVGRADSQNIRVLRSIVGYLWNEFPRHAWGSSEKYKDWIKAKRSEDSQ